MTFSVLPGQDLNIEAGESLAITQLLSGRLDKVLMLRWRLMTTAQVGLNLYGSQRFSLDEAHTGVGL